MDKEEDKQPKAGASNALIRSKNYLDLNDESRDHIKLQLTMSDNQTQEQHSSNDNQTKMSYMNFDINANLQDENEFERESTGTQADYLNAEILDNTNQNVTYNHISEIDASHQNSNAQKLEILRHLVVVERQSNERRRQNNERMQNYLKLLQTDYLRQQRDLVEALELSHKIKNQKDAQIEVISATIDEKDKLIEQLREKIESLDESRLRNEFQESLKKQNELAHLERQQLRGQLEIMEQQLVRERVSNSQTLQQFQEKINDQLEAHDKETSKWKNKIKDLESELDQIINEPQNFVVKSLKDERNKLVNSIDELNMSLDESRSKHEMLRKRLESLLVDHEQSEKRYQEEINRLQEMGGEQRGLINEYCSELEDKQESIQVLQFNLQRSEKRAKNLLGALKGKELAYKEIINQLRAKHEEQYEKTTNELRLVERNLIEKSNELDKKQTEIVRLEMERDNQLESMRNDRDQRINKLVCEKQRIGKELQVTEMKLATEAEQSAIKSKIIEKLKSEVDQFRQESKRLSIELTKTGAKLFNKQQELELALNKPSVGSTGNEQQQQTLNTLEFEEIQRHSHRLESTIEQLKKDNSKLSLKLRVSEANLVRLNAAVNKEQTKMYRDYETKMEQVRAEQCNYDRSKLRYKKYGQKLKKYCEHLRQVHEHLCNPSVCGYAIWDPICKDLESSKTNNPVATCRTTIGRMNKKKLTDQNSLQSSDDEHKSDDLDDKSRDQNLCSTPNRYIKRHHDKFAIKRTGLSPLTVNLAKSALVRRPSQKSILKSNSRTNQSYGSRDSLGKNTQNPSEHDYYSIIDENSKLLDTTLELDSADESKMSLSNPNYCIGVE